MDDVIRMHLLLMLRFIPKCIKILTNAQNIASLLDRRAEQRASEFCVGLLLFYHVHEISAMIFVHMFDSTEITRLVHSYGEKTTVAVCTMRFLSWSIRISYSTCHLCPVFVFPLGQLQHRVVKITEKKHKNQSIAKSGHAWLFTEGRKVRVRRNKRRDELEKKEVRV